MRFRISGKLIFRKVAKKVGECTSYEKKSFSLSVALPLLCTHTHIHKRTITHTPYYISLMSISCRENPEEGQGCVMKSTVINTSKEMMSFSDFPVPEKYPNFMHNTQVGCVMCKYIYVTHTYTLYYRIPNQLKSICNSFFLLTLRVHLVNFC